MLNENKPDDQLKWANPEQRKKEKYLRECAAFYENKRFKDALMICNLIIQIDQNCAEAYRIKALSLIGLKCYAEAIITCELMSRFSPPIPDAYINKGLALYKLGRYNEVIVACEQAIQIDVHNARAYHGRAVANLALKQYDKAIIDCLAAIFLGTESAAKCLTVGEALFELQRYSEAGEAYRQSIYINKSYMRAYLEKVRLLINKGKKLLDLGYNDKALATYEQVLLFDPDDEAQENVRRAVRNILILKLQKETDQNERRNLALRADKFFEAEFSSKQAEYLLTTEDCCEAAKFYKQAISFNPEFEDNYKERGRDLLVKSLDLYEVGHVEEAYLIYKQAILFDPYNQQVSYVRGRPLDKLKNLLREQDQIQTAETPQFVLNQIKQKEEIDYEELMLEGYDGERKIALIDNVSDPDEYDDNYNQYYEIDLEYDIDD